MTTLKSLQTFITYTFVASTLAFTVIVNAHDYGNEALEKAMSGEHRSAKHKARDEFRHPKETLEFFGFKSNQTVVEITPGGGWYTEILAPALKGTGVFYGAQYPNTGKDDYYSKARKSLEKKIASNAVYSEMKLTDFVPKQPSELAPKDSADLVLTFRNLHNWGEVGITQVFKDAYRALKPGGVLGVVEHRMPTSQKWEENKKSGYIPVEMVVRIAKSVGFALADSSEINANPKDTANHPKGVWSLPPVLMMKDKDREKYIAIGESDRMTLKFVKPAIK